MVYIVSSRPDRCLMFIFFVSLDLSWESRYIAQANLKVPIPLLCPPSAGITGVHHHAWLCPILNHCSMKHFHFGRMFCLTPYFTGGG